MAKSATSATPCRRRASPLPGAQFRPGQLTVAALVRIIQVLFDSSRNSKPTAGRGLTVQYLHPIITDEQRREFSQTGSRHRSGRFESAQFLPHSGIRESQKSPRSCSCANAWSRSRDPVTSSFCQLNLLQLNQKSEFPNRARDRFLGPASGRCRNVMLRKLPAAKILKITTPQHRVGRLKPI
jgi:hypothetical protein